MIGYLSRKEQLWLVEQLAHRLRENLTKSDVSKQTTFKSQLAAMAADPEVQDELQKTDEVLEKIETAVCYCLGL